MERHERTVFDFTKDEDDKLLTTSHEESHYCPSISIHCTDNGTDGFCMYITKGQAKDLIGKLEESIPNLEKYRRKQKEEI